MACMNNEPKALNRYTGNGRKHVKTPKSCLMDQIHLDNTKIRCPSISSNPLLQPKISRALRKFDTVHSCLLTPYLRKSPETLGIIVSVGSVREANCP